MATPFEVYLKALALLRQLTEPPRRPSADLPTHYQQLLIARVLRQLTEYGGALVVAATGLGKTLLGAEIAAHCHSRGLTRRIIVLGPAGSVCKEWLRHLCRDRDLLVDYFSLETLFLNDSANEDHQVEKLRECLRTADAHTLLIIDEVHAYRNQWLREAVAAQSSRVFARVVPAVRAQGARVLLLTATVYGTDFGNLKSLLRLLPTQPAVPGAVTREWDARDATRFAALPVVTVLGIPHVLQLARERGDFDETGRVFVALGGRRCYLPPTLELHAPRYPLPWQAEMQQALDQGRFASTTLILHAYLSEGLQVEKGAANSVFNEAVAAWLSSPAALAECLARNLATPGQRDPADATGTGSSVPYYYRLQQKQATRQAVLGSLLAACRTPDYPADAKFGLLRAVVQQACLLAPGPRTGKVLVFVNRWPTAVYVAEGLTAAFGGAVRVTSTVARTAHSTCELLLPPERIRRLRDFAPVAQKRKGGPGPDYHVLICTDADGKGVNLQDADTLVHYDLPGAADELYQRVGRLLRLTPDPERRIAIHTLEPALAFTHQGELLTSPSAAQQTVEKAVVRLQRRHDHARRIIGTGVRTGREYAQEPLEVEVVNTLAYLAVEDLTATSDAPTQAELRHGAVLQNHRDQATALGTSLLSAHTYPGTRPYLIALLHARGELHLIRYNLKTGRVENAGEDTLLADLSCEPTTERAPVPLSIVEWSANQAARVWSQSQQLPLDEVTKICALYLEPQSQAKRGAKRLLQDATS